MSLEHPNLAVLWSRNFKAPCKVVNRDGSKGYRTDFHSNHSKVFMLLGFCLLLLFEGRGVLRTAYTIR